MSEINGNIALGAAVGEMADVTMGSQMSASVEILTLIGCSAPLSIDWSKQWAEDAKQYYIDSLSIIEDPKYSAVAAADYAKYQIDLQKGQNEMGSQDNLLQNNKSVLKTLGNAMDQVYNIMQVPIQQQKALSKELLILAG